MVDKGKCSSEERKAEAHSDMGVLGEMFVTDGVKFSRRGTWGEKSRKSGGGRKDNQRNTSDNWILVKQR